MYEGMSVSVNKKIKGDYTSFVLLINGFTTTWKDKWATSVHACETVQLHPGTNCSVRRFEALYRYIDTPLPSIKLFGVFDTFFFICERIRHPFYSFYPFHFDLRDVGSGFDLQRDEVSGIFKQQLFSDNIGNIKTEGNAVDGPLTVYIYIIRYLLILLFY